MEQLSQHLDRVLSQAALPSAMAPKTQNALRILKSQSGPCEPGKTVAVNGLDLIPSDVFTEKHISQAIAYLENNFGQDYPREKWMMLVEQIMDDGWTYERFKRTVKHFLRTQKYPNWTVADWFSFGIQVHSYAWYMEQVHLRGITANDSIECYQLPDGTVCYRYADEQRLPFPRKMIREKTWSE